MKTFHQFQEARLTADQRRALPNKDFALPGKGEGPKGKQAGSYPIPDEKHARSALSLVSQHGTPEEKATVRAKVKKKFPNIQQESMGGGVPLTPQELEIQKKMSRLNVRLARKRSQQMQKAKVDDTETAPEQVKEASAVLDANKKIKNKEKREKDKKELMKLIKRYRHEKAMENPAKAFSAGVSEAKVDKGRSDYGKATIRNYRRSGPGHSEPAMFDPENKRGKTIDKRREEHKERRGKKGAKVPAYKVEETQVDEATRLKKEKGYDKGGTKKPSGKPTALSVVLDKIKKEHGAGAVMGQGGSRQKKKEKGAKSSSGTGKYLKRAQDKKAYVAKAKKAGFKSTKDYTNTVARYGSEDNYKKGKGLGT